MGVSVRPPANFKFEGRTNKYSLVYYSVHYIQIIAVIVSFDDDKVHKLCLVYFCS